MSLIGPSLHPQFVRPNVDSGPQRTLADQGLILSARARCIVLAGTMATDHFAVDEAATAD
jgi:hypothetical protein